MALVDELSFNMLILGFAGLLIGYLIGDVYVLYRRRIRSIPDILKHAEMPLAMLGVYMFVMGSIGQLSSLPAQYSWLFLDPFVAFGLLLIATALSIKYETGFMYVGLLALLMGVMGIWYGYNVYALGLTEEPLMIMLAYVLFGIGGVFGFPASIAMDRLPGYQKEVWKGWYVVITVCWLALVTASLIIIYLGLATVAAQATTLP